MRICCSYNCSDPTPMLCSTSQGKMHSPMISAALQTGSQLACVTATTPMKICCSCKCAVTHHQCTAALVWAKCIPHCTALQNRLTACLCHCNHTCEDLLLIQVCSDPTPMHCSTAFGKMHSTLSSAALQTGSQLACVTATTPMKICCSCKCAVTHHQCTAALVWAKCIPHCQVLLCKTGSQLACVTATTPMKICCSCKCAVTHHQCTAALVWAKCIPHCQVLLCKTGSQHGLCHCNYTYEDLLLMQVCSDPPPMHCSTCLGKMHSTLSSAALQNRLTTGLCHCNYTYEDLLLIQVCSDPPPMHCSTGFGKMHSTLSSAALQKRLTSWLVSLQLHL